MLSKEAEFYFSLERYCVEIFSRRFKEGFFIETLGETIPCFSVMNWFNG